MPDYGLCHAESQIYFHSYSFNRTRKLIFLGNDKQYQNTRMCRLICEFIVLTHKKHIFFMILVIIFLDNKKTMFQLKPLTFK